jgi:transposase
MGIAPQSRGNLMLVAMALANKMARSIWAMLTKQEDYRHPRNAAA